MSNGYKEDKSIVGGDKDHYYNFYYWSFIDIFIYFSHHRVTIPRN